MLLNVICNNLNFVLRNYREDNWKSNMVLTNGLNETLLSLMAGSDL